MNPLNTLQVNPHVLRFNKTSNLYSLFPSIIQHIVTVCNPRAEKKPKTGKKNPKEIMKKN